MDIEQQIARIRADGEALAVAAEDGPLDARVPGCPEWDVDALVRHIADVHRWAAAVVRDRAQERLRLDSEGPAQPGPLLEWYRQGCSALIETLEAASPDDAFWFWGPAPNALAFWARRQANETAVHRCDAESARGPITPLATVDAADAIDEWFGLAVRRAKAPEGDGRIIRLVATDNATTWNVRLGERVEVVTEMQGSAQCELRGAASDLYLWSMNRQGREGLTLSGDEGLLQVWANNVRF
jgi:uncharacterized protein (TIGR03083 family)